MSGLAPAPPPDLLFGASLFLDFDGTLVEIAERPDAVRVSPAVGPLLTRLSDRLDGGVALISGRPAAQVRALLGEVDATVVGSHGLEFHWSDGRIEMLERPAPLATALAAMRGLAAGTPGLLVEEKPLGVALHFRQVPAAEESCVALAMRLAADTGLQLQPGKMMIEVRAAGGDKGTAIRALMQEPHFAPTRPVFMGDDLTDEPGFVAAQALGGAGVLVGPARASAAHFRINGVQDTLGWLETACEAIA